MRLEFVPKIPLQLISLRAHKAFFFTLFYFSHHLQVGDVSITITLSSIRGHLELKWQISQLAIRIFTISWRLNTKSTLMPACLIEQREVDTCCPDKAISTSVMSGRESQNTDAKNSSGCLLKVYEKVRNLQCWLRCQNKSSPSILYRVYRMSFWFRKATSHVWQLFTFYHNGKGLGSFSAARRINAAAMFKL